MAKSKWPMVKKRFAEIEIWLKKGLSEKQIIKNLPVGKTTWERYKKNHQELRELLKKGRKTQITEVENSLFKSAKGFYYHEDKIIKVKDGQGKEHTEKITVKKFKSPNVGAAIFFLKNKDREKWADNPQMIELRREEFEHKKKMDEEFGDW